MYTTKITPGVEDFCTSGALEDVREHDWRKYSVLVERFRLVYYDYFQQTYYVVYTDRTNNTD